MDWEELKISQHLNFIEDRISQLYPIQLYEVYQLGPTWRPIRGWGCRVEKVLVKSYVVTSMQRMAHVNGVIT